MGEPQSYVERIPLRSLATRVRTVWVQHTGAEPYVQRHLPTGGVELHCRIGSIPRLVGPLTAALVEVLPADATIVGVRFWPGTATPLLGLPADELVDQSVSLADLWRSEAIRLGELLTNAPTPDAALDLLQRHLVSMQNGLDRPDPLVAVAAQRLMPWQPVGISALTAELAISASQLRRRFLTAVGLGPKPLQRTLRFQGYLALAQAAGSPSARPLGVADLAADVGYADHAHLSRECHRLTGLTPTELLLGDVDRCGCGHDHTASYLPFLAGRRRVPRAG